jgi:Fe-S cluster assembly iron-binding protein IscA
VLTLTPAAVEVVNALTTGPGVPDTAGLRIASTPDTPEAGGLQVELVSGPAEADQVVAEPGARVFVEQGAAPLVDDKVLNGELDEQGGAHFSLVQQNNGNGPTE